MNRFATTIALVTGLTSAAIAADPYDWTAHPVHQWVKQSPREGAPVPRLQYEGSGAWSPDQRLWIHFAGHDGIPQGFLLFTCSLDNGIWKHSGFPNTSPPGVCCVDGGNTYDEASGRFVAFPGGSLGHGYQWSRGVKLKQSNVWLYDPVANLWTNMRPPPYRQPEKYSRDVIGGLNHGATYDANHEVLITFGGQGAGGSTNTLFVYDAYANRLEQLRPPEPPSERDGMGLCYDTTHECLVMFGSQYGDDEKTWLYRFDENRWESFATDPHPPGRKEGTYSTNPKLAFDPASGLCLCVVRRGEESGLAPGTLETWTLDVRKRQWTKEDPAVSPDPSASRARNLGYSAEHDVFVLESVAADKGGPKLWTYRLAPSAAKTHLEPPADVRLVTQPGRALIRWKARDDAGVTSYNIYRAQADDVWKAAFTKIASTQTPEFEETALAAGKTYFYRVASVDAAGRESRPGRIVRTQPRVTVVPVVSVVDARRVEISWKARPPEDVVGYDLYRGVAAVQTVTRGKPAAWSDNDPEYAEPQVVAVTDITDLRKLNDTPVAGTEFVDTGVDLAQRGTAAGDYRWAVYAYVVRAVNRLGTSSGPSPYALTIPAEPQHVMLREREGIAEIRWNPAAEKSVTGYHIYKLGKSHWEIFRLTDEPLRETTFSERVGANETRYWVVPVDRLGQEGQPSSPVWCNHDYRGFFEGEWHQ